MRRKYVSFFFHLTEIINHALELYYMFKRYNVYIRILNNVLKYTLLYFRIYVFVVLGFGFPVAFYFQLSPGLSRLSSFPAFRLSSFPGFPAFQAFQLSSRASFPAFQLSSFPSFIIYCPVALLCYCSSILILLIYRRRRGS